MIVSQLVAESPRRWRYPRLVEALATGSLPDDPVAIAGLVLDGLVRPREPFEVLESLILDREFDAASYMYRQLQEQSVDGGLDDPRLAGFTDRLQMARDAARQRIEAQWQTLNDRARRVGLAPAPSADVLAAGDRSFRAVDALVVSRTRVIADAERRRRQQLIDELRRSDHSGSTETALPPGAERALAAGDFDLAQEILRAGPDRTLETHSPLATPRPPSPPSWPGSFEELLDRYAHRWPVSAEDNRYLPDRDDQPAADLVTAIAALRGAADHARAQSLATSLARAVGGTALLPEPVGEPPADLTFRLTPPPGDLLVKLFPAARQGIPIRIRLRAEEPASAPLPPCGVVLHPGPQSETTGQEPVLCASDILPLLARPVRNDAVVPTRWVNLLRAVLSRIPPEELLGEGVVLAGPRGTRTALAWVFDLMDRVPDELLLDALLHEVGDHPQTLRTAVVALTAGSAPGSRLSVDHWHQLVPQLLPQLRQDVLESIRTGTVLMATLALVLESFRSGTAFTPTEVYASMKEVAGPRGLERLVDAENIDNALEGLVRLHILRRSAQGFRLPAVAVTDAFMNEPLDLDLLAGDLERQAEWLDQEAAMAIGPLAVRALGHRLDNDVLRICRAMDQLLQTGMDSEPGRHDLSRIRDEVAAMGGGSYARLYFESLAPGQVVDVSDIVRQATAGALPVVPPGMAVTPDIRSSGCRVEIVPALLETCLMDLILNAAAAFSGFDARPRAMIFVKVLTAGDLPGGLTVPPVVAPDAVMIEIRDNGPGFQADQLARLQAELGVEEDMRRLLAGGFERGRGLPLAAAVTRHFKGDLEIGEPEAGSSGAVVRLWLPRAAVRTVD